MGADIHMVIECFYDRRWVGLCEPNRLPRQNKVQFSDSLMSNRNYRLFHHLANVRGREEWGESLLGPPRGLPKDISDLGYMMLADPDEDYGYHSHSWATLEEFLMAYNLAEEGYVSCCSPSRIPKVYTEDDILGGLWYRLKYNKHSVRIVFAFDN